MKKQYGAYMDKIFKGCIFRRVYVYEFCIDTKKPLFECVNIYRYLLGKHKAAMDTYSEASMLYPHDWVRCYPEYHVIVM